MDDSLIRMKIFTRLKHNCTGCNQEVELLEFEGVSAYVEAGNILHLCKATREPDPFGHVVRSIEETIRAIFSEYEKPLVDFEDAIARVQSDLASDVRQWLDVVCSDEDMRLLVTQFISNLIKHRAMIIFMLNETIN